MKDFKRMKTEKLKSLLLVVSDEEKAQIETILAERAQKAAADTAANNVGLSPEETATIEAVESGEAQNADKQKKEKMSDEELEKLVANLKETAVGHRCQVLPFNTPEWVDGTIVAVTAEKRANKALLAIKTDSGKRIMKVYDSPCLRILEETVEVVRQPRARKTEATKNAEGEWDLEADIQKFIGNVGKLVHFVPFGAADKEETGRIIALVPDKRVNTILYRIEVINEDGSKTIRNKVAGSEALKIDETFDEVGQALNEKYVTRHNEAPKAAATPAERVKLCEEAVAKAEAALAKAQTTLEQRKKALEAAKAELLASGQSEMTEEAGTTESIEASEASEVGDVEDIM